MIPRHLHVITTRQATRREKELAGQSGIILHEMPLTRNILINPPTELIQAILMPPVPWVFTSRSGVEGCRQALREPPFLIELPFSSGPAGRPERPGGHETPFRPDAGHSPDRSSPPDNENLPDTSSAPEGSITKDGPIRQAASTNPEGLSRPDNSSTPEESSHSGPSGSAADVRPPRIYAIGTGTAGYADFGDIPVVIPDVYNATALADRILKDTQVTEVVHWCGVKRRPELQDILRDSGVHVHEIIVYNTEFNHGAAVPDIKPDAVLFYSPGAAEALMKMTPVPEWKCPLIAIGGTTADALDQAGLKNIFTAAESTPEAMMQMALQLNDIPDD